MNEKDNKFSIVKRGQSFTHAWRGIGVCLKSTHNAWIHIVIFLFAIFLGIFFHITKIEWLFVLLASGFVFTAETFNTAIEIDIDLTSPDHHPFARDTKDVSAGAVLISAITAFIIGAIIFIPYLYNF